MLEVADRADVVHLDFAPGWLTASRWQALNIRRERLSEARARWLHWLSADELEMAARHAQDWWAWRDGVFAFVAPTEVDLGIPAAFDFSERAPSLSSASTPIERIVRIDELAAWLSANASADKRLQANVVDELILLLFADYRFAEAVPYLKRAVTLYRSLGERDRAAMCKVAYGDVLRTLGETDRALRIYETQARRLSELKATILWAQTRFRVVSIWLQKRRLGKARDELANRLLPLAERLGDTGMMAVGLGLLADLERFSGRTREALEIEQRVLSIALASGRQRMAGIALAKIGHMLATEGRFDEARAQFNRALTTFQGEGSTADIAAVLGRLAAVDAANGNFDSALSIHREQVLPLLQKDYDLTRLIMTHRTIGRLLQNQHKPSDALTEFHFAGELARRAGNKTLMEAVEQDIAGLRSQSQPEIVA